MSSHKRFTLATDIQVYFCDPKSPPHTEPPVETARPISRASIDFPIPLAPAIKPTSPKGKVSSRRNLRGSGGVSRKSAALWMTSGCSTPGSGTNGFDVDSTSGRVLMDMLIQFYQAVEPVDTFRPTGLRAIWRENMNLLSFRVEPRSKFFGRYFSSATQVVVSANDYKLNRTWDLHCCHSISGCGRPDRLLQHLIYRQGRLNAFCNSQSITRLK